MEPSENTPRQQFVQDVMLVLENERTAYERIMKEAKRLNATDEPVNLTTYRLAEFIQIYVQHKIDGCVRMDADGNGIGAALVREICLGWGIDPYYDMAQDFMTTAAESAGV